MGFFDLVNIRAINGKLKDIMPVVEANLSRLHKYYDDNFKVTKKQKHVLLSLDEPEEIVITTQEHINEFLRLKKEFEKEFESVRLIVEKIKPATVFGDDSSYVYWNNKLVSISWGYDMFIKILNHRKIYIKS
ncbi:MAG: hypothetical protein PF481_02705 [Bacteroidales bacterium]|jgi:hypothetical protein|nr:hypothetical protein [Bacteroidales bacterium]